jgi:hypothetical protein
MEKFVFTRANLSNVRVIIAIMCVLMNDLLCQVVMEHVSILTCLLSSARGRLWLRSVMPNIKWCRFPRPWPHGALTRC